MVRLRRLMKTEGAEDFLAATGMSWMKRQASHKPDILIWCLLLTSVVVLASLVAHSGPRKKPPRFLVGILTSVPLACRRSRRA